MYSEAALRASVPGFVAQLESRLAALNIRVDGLDLDHVCWRCSTQEEYASVVSLTGAFGVLLVEQPVSGRQIATFRLNAPIVCLDRLVSVLEVASPKQSSPYPSGTIISTSI